METERRSLIRLRLPDPYIGWFSRTGAGCDLCASCWTGDGACSCGSSWTTTMLGGEEPDPDDEVFWETRKRAS